MKAFIIGASGLVGSNMLTHFKDEGWEVFGSHYAYSTEATEFFNTLNLEDENNADIKALSPDVIVHCGALTHVDYCEDNEQESYDKTVQSTLNVIELCKSVGARMIYISTDYIFDGVEGPYGEEAKSNPLSIYGRHKLMAEQAVQSAFNDALVIRVAKVYGIEERKKNFVARLMSSLDEGSLTWSAFTDQYTSTVNAWDIGRACQLLARDNKSGVYHISNGEYFSVFELVSEITAEYPEADINVKPIVKGDFVQRANRPALGGLSNKKFCSEYPDFTFGKLREYVAKNKASK